MARVYTCLEPGIYLFCTGTYHRHISWFYVNGSRPSARPGSIAEKGYLSLTEALMRIPAHEMLFIGQDRCSEFGLCKEPLPDELNILLCLLDGAERRRQMQTKLNADCLDLSPEAHNLARQSQSVNDSGA
jgi:hypothetical protein